MLFGVLLIGCLTVCVCVCVGGGGVLSLFCCAVHCVLSSFSFNSIYSSKAHDIHKYNVKITGSDSKP